MKERRIFIGIDGGATKTAGALGFESGKLAAFETSASANPNDIGAEASAEVLVGLARRLLGSAGAADDTPSAIFAGVSGGTNHRDFLLDELRKAFPRSKVELKSDAVNLLSSGLGAGGDGCALISGTGSACFTRKNGALDRVGGWGYLIDTAGSGFDLGRDCLAEALREFDGRGGSRTLRELVKREAGAYPESMLGEFYRLGKAYIASFAPLVFEADAVGDERATALIERHMSALAELVNTAGRKSFHGLPFRVVLGGGILERNPRAREALAAKLGPSAEPLLPSLPPVWGAFAEALAIVGNTTDEAVRKRFADTLTLYK